MKRFKQPNNRFTFGYWYAAPPCSRYFYAHVFRDLEQKPWLHLRIYRNGMTTFCYLKNDEVMNTGHWRSVLAKKIREMRAIGDHKPATEGEA